MAKINKRGGTAQRRVRPKPLKPNIAGEDALTPAQVALLDNERQLSTLFANFPGMAYSCQNDVNWTMTIISEGCKALTGYTQTELLQNRAVTYGDLIHPEDRKSLWEKCQSSLNAHKACSNEYRIIARSGEVRWVSERAQGIYAADGTLLGIEGFVQDITERKQSEATISKMTQRLEIALEGSQISVWETDLRTNEVWLDARWATYIGEPKAETRTTSRELLELVHPDDRQKIAAAAVQTMTGETASYAIDHRVKSANGEWKWILSRGRVTERDATGSPLRMSGTNTDITAHKTFEQRLQGREAELSHFKRTLDQTLDCIFMFRMDDLRFIYVNQGAQQQIGYTETELLGMSPLDIKPNYTPESFRQLTRPLIAGTQDSINFETVHRHKDGYEIPVEIIMQLIRQPGGDRIFVAIVRDISERVMLSQRITMEHAVTQILAESTTFKVAIQNIVRTVCQTLDWSCGAYWRWNETIQELNCAEVWHEGSEQVAEFISASIQNPNEAPVWTGAPPGSPAGGVVRRAWMSRVPVWFPDVMQHPDFRRGPQAVAAGLHSALAFPIVAGMQPLGVIEFYGHEIKQPDQVLLKMFQAISSQIGQFSQRKEAEERNLQLAHYDQLTGLANRNMVNKIFSQALARAKRNGKPLAILFIDLDRFKNINDTLGHGAGDNVLKEVAERLRRCLRDSDTVGRLGGDEFVALLEDMPQATHSAVAAQKIIDALTPPFILETQEFHITASIGISTYPADSEDVPSLLKNADIAMYRAKDLGKNNYQFYSSQMNLHTLDRLALESNLRRALEREEFILHYQPKVDIRTGYITGMEALVRWQHPTNGLIPPMQFIPLAEETGLIVPIGEWVFRTACAQTASWRKQGLPPLRVAVNLSARQFRHEHLLQSVGKVLHDTGLDPTGLELEITESMVMQDPERAVLLLDSLRAMGISISIDDFGTGYSSLSYLKRFPIDSLKIDRSFIKNLPLDTDDAAIAQAIIAMAHTLRMSVIAEGVETEEQLRFLRDYLCEEVQGYYFSKPVPEHEFAAFVLKNTASR